MSSSSLNSPPGLNSFSEYMRQPTGLAVLASIGIHGVFFMILSVVSGPFEAAESDPLEPVPLVTLSSAEQRRLPAFARPKSSTSPGQSDLFQIPSLAGNRENGLRNPSTSPFGNVVPPLFPGPIPNYQPPSPFLFRRPPLARRPPSVSVLPNIPRRPSVPLPTSPPVQPPPTPAEAAPQKKPLNLIGVDDLEGFSGAIVKLPELSGNVTQPEETAKNPEERIQEIREELKQARAGYEYNPEGTAENDALTRSDEWLARIREKSADPEIIPGKPIDISIDYERRNCLPTRPNVADVRILVNAEGMVDEPELIFSTGYDALNQKAIEAIKENFEEVVELPTAEKEFKAYQFRVTVNYDSDNLLNFADGALVKGCD
ncbi:MAG: hypothetical protein F6K19_40840 [Cyanothece sp. SIO1E1]|nr:hypothetical protein [Cyanothece sp. SIO1E1]